MEPLTGAEGHRLPFLVNLQIGAGDPAYSLEHPGQIPANDELRKVHSLQKNNLTETARSLVPLLTGSGTIESGLHLFKAAGYRQSPEIRLREM